MEAGANLFVTSTAERSFAVVTTGKLGISVARVRSINIYQVHAMTFRIHVVSRWISSQFLVARQIACRGHI